MIGVEIPLRQWTTLFAHTRDGDKCVLYDLSNGLVIDSNSIIMPWEYSGQDVVVGFDSEQDAAWFILSYGGKILE